MERSSAPVDLVFFMQPVELLMTDALSPSNSCSSRSRRRQIIPELQPTFFATCGLALAAATLEQEQLRRCPWINFQCRFHHPPRRHDAAGYFLKQ